MALAVWLIGVLAMHKCNQARRRIKQLVVETTEGILNAPVQDKRRANTVAARRSGQRKLEHVKKLEDELGAVNEAKELWKARAIAAEGMLREMQARSS
ncbi:hypothetical protein FRC09_005602 [Ceratobasidium sp. 395]|nr:hypothetical protein FRC09_005602 [Ceratobasidium sp. 395]